LLDFSGFAAQQCAPSASWADAAASRALRRHSQIGDANRIAERTGIDVVADFDVATWLAVRRLSRPSRRALAAQARA
jgi:1,6-anhydro-N-acetylmuramate kinase